MNWWQRFWSNPYKWGLWHWIGGRPWTYIMRDFYHKFEYLIIIGFFALGYFIRPHLTIREFWLAIGAGTLCFLLGHLFWGTDYKEGQQGK